MGCIVQLTGVPREAELKLGDVSSQASLAFNVLASVLGGGFVGYWLAGNISSDIMVRLTTCAFRPFLAEWFAFAGAPRCGCCGWHDTAHRRECAPCNQAVSHGC